MFSSGTDQEQTCLSVNNFLLLAIASDKRGLKPPIPQGLHRLDTNNNRIFPGLLLPLNSPSWNRCQVVWGFESLLYTFYFFLNTVLSINPLSWCIFYLLIT